MNSLKSQLRARVETFLSEYKNSLDENYLDFRYHYDNQQTLLKYGLTKKNVIDFLYDLKPENYYKGPSPDEYNEGVYWEFGVEIDGNPIYIKIKIETDQYGNDHPVCFSFHDPRFTLVYPLTASTS